MDISLKILLRRLLFGRGSCVLVAKIETIFGKDGIMFVWMLLEGIFFAVAGNAVWKTFQPYYEQHGV